MKNKILNYVRGLYYYYSTGASAHIPYFSTISALSFVVFLHIIQIVIFLGRFANIKIDLFPMPADVHKGVKLLMMALYLLPIYFLIMWLFPKKNIDIENCDIEEVKKYKYSYFIYLGLNVLIIVLLVSDKIVFKK